MNKTVYIVTGAFGALGRSVAATLARQGASLALLDAAPTVPDAIAGAYAQHLLLPGVDLANAAATEAAAQRVQARFGGLDGVVNVAGGFRWETIADGSPETWDLMYTLNVKTALHTCRAALPLLKTRGAGRIVNIGAGAAARAGMGMGAYAASKAGVLRLTEALAEECKELGINVNCILPSIIDTPANRRDMPEADFSRWVAPEAIADVVAFLLGDGARAITGAGIAVSGRV
jgi:NAD(P)-dependent dehydrogenase (short-subunit alcohol dehydrogenase family)